MTVTFPSGTVPPSVTVRAQVQVKGNQGCYTRVEAKKGTEVKERRTTGFGSATEPDIKSDAQVKLWGASGANFCLWDGDSCGSKAGTATKLKFGFGDTITRNAAVTQKFRVTVSSAADQEYYLLGTGEANTKAASLSTGGSEVTAGTAVGGSNGAGFIEFDIADPTTWQDIYVYQKTATPDSYVLSTPRYPAYTPNRHMYEVCIF